MWSQGTKVTREEMYEQVWAEPMRLLAPKYGISDVALKKVCVKLDVPVPPRGYWAKLEAGKTVRKPPLRKIAPGKSNEAWIRGGTKPMFEEFRKVDTKELLESRKGTKIKVSDRLAKPHPLIAQALELRQARKKKGATYTYTPSLAVHATDEHINRALRIMDALLKALEAEGQSVKVGKDGKTEITVWNEHIKISLDEKTRGVPHVPTAAELAQAKRDPWYSVPTTDREYTGELVIKLDAYAENCRKSWSDGKKQRLEDLLDDVMVGIIAVADALRARTLYWENHRRIEAEAAAKAAERRRQQELAAARRKRLTDLAGQLESRRLVAQLISEVEAKAKLMDDDEKRSQLQDWVAWAKGEAEQVNPVNTVVELVTRQDW